MEELVYELNFEGARLARRAAEARGSRTAGAASWRARWGRRTARSPSRPTSTTLLPRRDVRRGEGLLREQLNGLIDGGAEIILIETIFDTLNAKAAIVACFEQFEENGVDLPIMISGTITDLSGRTLSGQTPTAFWHSVRHAAPITIGLNCALGAKRCALTLAEISRAARKRWCAPIRTRPANEFGMYDESPEYMASLIAEFADAGLVNVVGGCCGSTPAHIRAIAEAVKGKKPRAIPERRAS